MFCAITVKAVYDKKKSPWWTATLHPCPSQYTSGFSSQPRSSEQTQQPPTISFTIFTVVQSFNSHLQYYTGKAKRSSSARLMNDELLIGLKVRKSPQWLKNLRPNYIPARVHPPSTTAEWTLESIHQRFILLSLW